MTIVIDRLEALDAYHFALELFKKAGFVLANASMSTETCYYFHPGRGRDCLLRVSMHKSKKSPPIGLGGVCARLTFASSKATYSEGGVRTQVMMAIGAYFLGQPRESKYDGPRERRHAGIDDLRTGDDRAVQLPQQ